ncbi:hypothetical protein F9L33_05730 [Amylibacter sp. SFDW26]|uniref:hypothetical protein n=1 Tax=Amylibacter sp. SFDW26 TaxID=2652722 RepID=UPI00132BEDB3|nr:hypothetical protein [Amylibacter sp. SFDW26]KAB7616249.1 hypothetical protein F9L33_05730 [Amylibacter sp. SFDW26]
MCDAFQSPASPLAGFYFCTMEWRYLLQEMEVISFFYEYKNIFFFPQTGSDVAEKAQAFTNPLLENKRGFCQVLG